MNLKTKLAATLLMIGSASMAQATSYSVEGIFTEPMAMGGTTTEFNGGFNWDTSLDFATNTSNIGLTGMMNSSMAFMPGMPNLSLTNNVLTSLSGTVVTASVFLNMGTNVFDATFGGGGYDAIGGAFPGTTSGTENAYFTFSFDTAGGMVAATGLTTTMQYGDCTADGMMGPACMTGFGVMSTANNTENGTMRGFAQSLTISEVSAVPVPAAAWLFGGALVSLFGANRRKNVLPA